MKKLIYTIVLILSHPCWVAAQKGSAGINDKLRPAERIVLNSHIQKRLDQSYENRILAQDVDHLIEPFLNRNETRQWQSEFWGKWFTSAVLAYKYRPEERLKKILDGAVAGLIATQTPDGYIGNYRLDSRLKQWDIWGRKYTMLGLLDYHELTKDKASLEAARKVADHLIREINEADGVIVTKGNHKGMAASSVLEPMVQLYRNTRDQKYLDFAKQIVQQWETPQGPQLVSKAGVDVSKRFPKPQRWYGPEQGQKAYEMMSCYEGLLELYRITGDPAHRSAVERTWQNIRDKEINIAGSGASEEAWFDGRRLQTAPITHYQETCVTVTWIKFCQQLLRLTGEAKYADEIERAYYNALMASMSYDASDWAKYTPLTGQRLPGSGQCGMNLHCCNASGPRGQFTLPLTTVMSSSEGPVVNFYIDGNYHLKTPRGRSVVVKQQTDYPLSGKVRVTLDLARAEEMTLQLRIPAWSARNTVTVNGEAVGGAEPGQFIKLNRNWSSSDVVEMELDMRGKVIFHGDEERRFAAITRGPVVLARDSRFPGPPMISVNQPLPDDNGYIELKPVEPQPGDNVWMRYNAMFRPESYMEMRAEPLEITLCDYASAGNGKEPSTFCVWLPQLFSGRTNN